MVLLNKLTNHYTTGYASPQRLYWLFSFIWANFFDDTWYWLDVAKLERRM